MHTASTTGGPVWLKAPGRDTAFEVALYGLLSEVTPERITPPIVVDPAHGWVLLRDGGPVLGWDGDLVDSLVTVLPRYGQLQRELAPHADEPVGMGVADMRHSVMPERFDEAVAVVE